MVRTIIALFFCFPVALYAQTYQQLSERAIDCIEKDSLPQAEELLLRALKLEPKNAKNALLFSNLGLVQRRLGEFDKALESYSFALNFAPLAFDKTWNFDYQDNSPALSGGNLPRRRPALSGWARGSFSRCSLSISMLQRSS